LIGLINPAVAHEAICYDPRLPIAEFIRVAKAIVPQAANRYKAIHAADAARGGDSDSLRLTVHWKTERPEIPAIWLLGRRNGNLLPQHNVGILTTGTKIRALSMAEVLLHGGVRPVNVECNGGVSWPGCEDQPLLFSEQEIDWSGMPRLV
jgi:hypothetical protein